MPGIPGGSIGRWLGEATAAARVSEHAQMGGARCSEALVSLPRSIVYCGLFGPAEKTTFST